MTAPPTHHIPTPEARHWLHRLFVLRQLMETQLDRCFDGVPAPPNARIVLFNETDAGLGDAAFMHKAAHVLRAALPDVRLCLVAAEPAKHAVFGRGAVDELLDYAAFAQDKRGFDTPDLALSAPGIFDECRSRESVLNTLGLKLDTPFLYIAEYGSLRQLRDDAFKPLMTAIDAHVDVCLDAVAIRAGVNPDAAGHRGASGEILAVTDDGPVVIGSMLLEFAAGTDVSPLTPFLGAPLLHARSAGLEPGELGVHTTLPDGLADGGEPAAEPLVRELMNGRRGSEKADQQRALYVGYGHGGHGTFLCYISALEADRSRDIDVVLPTQRGVQRALDDFVHDVTASVLRAAGIARIEVVGNARDEIKLGPVARATRVLSGDDETAKSAGKTLRLITRHPLPWRDFTGLLQRAEPFVMISGDQSFSDAVALGSAPLVIEPMYCQTWALDAQLALAGAISPRYEQVLRFAMNARWDAAGWPEIRAALQSDEVRNAAIAWSERIRREHDLAPALVAAVNRALWITRESAVATAATEDLQRAWRSWNDPAGIDFAPVATQAVSARLGRGL